MHEFITKYKTDKVFREFIDELIDSNSTLWHEYAIEKTYNALVEHEDDIINDLRLIGNFLNHLGDRGHFLIAFIHGGHDLNIAALDFFDRLTHFLNCMLTRRYGLSAFSGTVF